MSKGIIVSREYLELVLADVDEVVRRHMVPEEEIEKRFGDVLGKVHSFLTGRVDTIDRITVVRTVERLENDGVVSSYSVEDKYRIAEWYMQRHVKKADGPSPESLIAMDA